MAEKKFNPSPSDMIKGQSIFQSIIDEARDIPRLPANPQPGEIVRDFPIARVWTGKVWMAFKDDGTVETEKHIRDAATKAMIDTPWDQWEARRAAASAERDALAEARRLELERMQDMSRYVPPTTTTIEAPLPPAGTSRYWAMAAWEKVVETWNDFGGAEGDYDDMCDALYSVVEEILNPDDPPPSVT